MSPTTITITQPVQFLTPDGNDVIVKLGCYEVRMEGNALHLQSPETKKPIHNLAGPAPFSEDVESPVAMTIPHKGMYLALAVPKDAGLEAMSSCNGIQPRGTSLLQIRKTLTVKRRAHLSAFANQLTRNPKTASLPHQWKQTTQQDQPQSQAARSSDGNAMLTQILRQSYVKTTKDLQSLTAKIKANIQKKQQLREQIQEVRGKWAQANEAKDKEAREKLEEKLKEAVQDLNDQNIHFQKEMQALMSDYQKVEKASSRIRKKQDSAQSNDIQKIIN